MSERLEQKRKISNYIILVLLTICVIHLTFINYKLYIEYQTVLGKKRALFGLQYFKYFYTLYLLGFEVLILLFLSISNGLKKKITYLGLLLVLISGCLIFFEPWQWFV